jgi:anti-sigma B factor antagonist
MGENRDRDPKAESLPGVADVALIRLSGTAGHGIVRELQEVLQPLLAQGTKKLVVDCSQIEFFNSAAFGYLINLSDSLRDAGGAVVLCRVPINVQLAFDYLGLKDFFKFFPDESKAVLSFRKASPPKAAPLSKPQTAREEARPEEPPSSMSFALPAWLDDVDKPGPPPLDHLRWSALLQIVLRRLGPESLAGITRRANVPAGAPPSLVARAILRGLRTPEDLLGQFDEDILGSVCRLFGLPEGGGKEELTQSLISFVQQSNTESLARFMEEEPKDVATGAPPGSPQGPTEPNQEDLLQALATCPVPKLLKSERSARDLLKKHLAKVFGKERVRTNRAVGRHLVTAAEIDVAERFGILVRLGKAFPGKKPKDAQSVLTLLGQVVVLAGVYGRGNLFVVLLGKLPEEQASALGELRAWVESVGGRQVHLP